MDSKRSRVTGSPRMATVHAALMAIGLLGATILFFIIGQADVSTALTYFGRLTGGFLLGAALITGIAALAVVNHRWGSRHLEYSGVIVMLGVLVVLGTSLMLLIVHVQGQDYSRYSSLLLWILFLFWSFWVLWQLYRQNVLRGTAYPKKFAVGVAITGVIAGANFMYSQVYEPSVSPINLSVTTKFGTPRPHPDAMRIYLPLTVNLENKSQVGLYLLGSIYYVSRVVGEYTATPRKDTDLLAELDQGRSTLDRFMNVSEYELVSTGNFIRPLLDSLNPGEKREFEHVVVLPRSAEYDVIQAWV